ncbi:MAG: 23S rRNA (uridine(2552)-2'-O)-methyltransferase RlmE [Desulfobacterales bacterium]
MTKKTRNRSASSQRWIDEHENDEFVLKARRLGYRSRARFKLEEIDQKDRLLKAGSKVIDLGAAPGGWAEYAAEKVGPQGRVIGLDILPMEPIPGVVFLQADFTEDAALRALEDVPGIESGIDLVLSDMAPNISGIDVSDQAKSMYLAELALDFAQKKLNSGGSFLAKVFQGAGFDEFLAELRTNFKTVVSRKPKASRARSREMYLLAKGYRRADD